MLIVQVSDIHVGPEFAKKPFRRELRKSTI